jgi:hypothetical protein
VNSPLVITFIRLRHTLCREATESRESSVARAALIRRYFNDALSVANRVCSTCGSRARGTTGYVLCEFLSMRANADHYSSTAPASPLSVRHSLFSVRHSLLNHILASLASITLNVEPIIASRSLPTWPPLIARRRSRTLPPLHRSSSTCCRNTVSAGSAALIGQPLLTFRFRAGPLSHSTHPLKSWSDCSTSGLHALSEKQKAALRPHGAGQVERGAVVVRRDAWHQQHGVALQGDVTTKDVVYDKKTLLAAFTEHQVSCRRQGRRPAGQISLDRARVFDGSNCVDTGIGGTVKRLCEAIRGSRLAALNCALCEPEPCGTAKPACLRGFVCIDSQCVVDPQFAICRNAAPQVDTACRDPASQQDIATVQLAAMLGSATAVVNATCARLLEARTAHGLCYARKYAEAGCKLPQSAPGSFACRKNGVSEGLTAIGCTLCEKPPVITLSPTVPDETAPDGSTGTSGPVAPDSSTVLSSADINTGCLLSPVLGFPLTIAAFRTI